MCSSTAEKDSVLCLKTAGLVHPTSLASMQLTTQVLVVRLRVAAAQPAAGGWEGWAALKLLVPVDHTTC